MFGINRNRNRNRNGNNLRQTQGFQGERKNFNNNQMQINDFRDKEALLKSGIQVLPFDEHSKREEIVNTNSAIPGNIVFATDEFKEKYLKEENELKEETEKYKKDSLKKVKFETSDIYKNELNRKYFYNSILNNCNDDFSKRHIEYIIKNCDKVFNIYEKERFFKEKVEHTPKSINVAYTKEMIMYAIEEENKNFTTLVTEYQSYWDYGKLNRVLSLKLQDISILNSILAYMK